jgi:hypothetical protein
MTSTSGDQPPPHFSVSTTCSYAFHSAARTRLFLVRLSKARAAMAIRNQRAQRSKRRLPPSVLRALPYAALTCSTTPTGQSMGPQLRAAEKKQNDDVVVICRSSAATIKRILKRPVADMTNLPTQTGLLKDLIKKRERIMNEMRGNAFLSRVATIYSEPALALTCFALQHWRMRALK